MGAAVGSAPPTAAKFYDAAIRVESDKVKYGKDEILAEYEYRTTDIEETASGLVCKPKVEKYTLRTKTNGGRVGVMFVGWGGNNGTTVTAGIIANREGLTWNTKDGIRKADYLGSVTQASTVRLGSSGGRDVYVPFSKVLPMANPNTIEIGGWDISSMNLGDAMDRAGVFPYDFQRQMKPIMETFTPLPSIYYPDFIAANQEDRADNVLPGTKKEHLEKIRQDIRDFKAAKSLDKVIVLWTANTERFSDVIEGVNTTKEEVLASIERGEEEVSPSTIFAVASILEGCSYINGSPQNTFVPGVIDLAEEHKVFIGGDDFKSGQTKMKSVLVDFLVGAGIKPVSIVSYNHLGNNDGKNLSAPKQFRSKEISKSNVVDDMVGSNGIMYKEGEHPDHTVVIKYVPFVGDSKRALDEYTSRIFMGGLNTIAMHNTCEDSLLAAPLIIDLVILTELMERITIKKEGAAEFETFHPVLSVLSYLLKAPLVPRGTPVINALFKQREAITNIMRACVGLEPENHMLLEHKLASAGSLAREAAAEALAKRKTLSSSSTAAEPPAKRVKA